MIVRYIGLWLMVSMLISSCRKDEISLLNKDKKIIREDRLISDFEGNGQVESVITYTYDPAQWNTYWNLPDSLTEIGVFYQQLNAPQGSNYLSVKGESRDDATFIGGFYCNVSLASFSNGNTDDVYFNAYINGGGNTHTLLILTLITDEGKYTYFLEQKWSGWKLVSIPASAFKKSGNTLNDISKVKVLDIGIDCNSLTDPKGECNVDYVIFTKGAPYSK